ncbi:MAG: hypothetical protein WA040_23915 [Anaerolineae bacterium]
MSDPFQPLDPHFDERVRASFQQQTVMAAIGASLRADAERVIALMQATMMAVYPTG